MDSTVGVKNWIISIFFKQKAIISHVSPDILYLFRVQAVCRNEMRSDFSQTMLFQGKKTNMHTYFYIKWLCVCLTFPLQSAIWCGMISDDVWMHADDAHFILWPVTLLESYFQWWGFAYTFLLAGVHQFLGERRDFLGISFLKQIHWRLFMHQGHSYSRMWVCGVCFM